MTLKDLYTDNNNLTHVHNYLSSCANHFNVTVEHPMWDDFDTWLDFCEGAGEYNARQSLAILYNEQTRTPLDHIYDCFYDLKLADLLRKDMVNQFDPTVNSTNTDVISTVEDFMDFKDYLLPTALFKYWDAQLECVFRSWVIDQREGLRETREMDGAL